MRWESLRRSGNIEDRRGRRSGSLVMGGGIGGVLIALLVYFLGGDPGAVLGPTAPRMDPAGPQSGESGAERPLGGQAEEQLSAFLSTVLGSTEDVWGELLRTGEQRSYAEPKLVMFTDAVNSACGSAQAAMGPFYCPRDQKIYLDLGFFNQLQNALGAGGDFAQAYVVAHEVGHHVQNLLGTLDAVQAQKGRVRNEAAANALQVQVELQADCLAGVWAKHADARARILEAGDIDEALGAASAVGDDTLQKRSRGHVVPDSFTHGSSEQRMTWFRRGLDGGQLANCDTFASDNVGLRD